MVFGSAIAAIMGGIYGGGRFITLGPTNATVSCFLVFAGIGLIQGDGMASLDALLLLPWILIASALFNSRKCSKDFVHDSVHFPDCNYCLYCNFVA